MSAFFDRGFVRFTDCVFLSVRVPILILQKSAYMQATLS